MEYLSGLGHRDIGLLELLFNRIQPIDDRLPFASFGLFDSSGCIPRGGSRRGGLFGCRNLGLEGFDLCSGTDDAILDIRIVPERFGLLEFLCGLVEQGHFLGDRLISR